MKTRWKEWVRPEELIDEENDPGLGNGGLGRLAACFLDSLATLALPGRGYGIRYDYGMFNRTSSTVVRKSRRTTGWNTVTHGSSLATIRAIRFVSAAACRWKANRPTGWRRKRFWRWLTTRFTPGYDTDATNTLRLWNAQASSEINLGKFNQGDYFAAVEDKNHSENVSVCSTRMTPPIPARAASAPGVLPGLGDGAGYLSRHYMLHKTYDNLADKIAIHLNDTHPVLSIPELMRLLIDEHKFSWEAAFEVACQVFSYTNHTLMSEALETLPVDMPAKFCRAICRLYLRLTTTS
ncbi:glycogen/starch/alpha-glucan phosphorylase [Shigella flexneri]